MATVRFALVGVCNISEEHARLSGPPHHRDTVRNERILVSCACVRWACCGRNAVVPKPPGRACQEGGMPDGCQRCFDDGGLFLVDGCSSCAPHLSSCLLVARDSAVCWDPLENYSACVAEFLHLCC